MQVPADLTNGTSATAPRLTPQQSLPMYEAVVMSDILNGEDGSVPAPPPGINEVPPQYHTLYPDGPPEQIKISNNIT